MHLLLWNEIYNKILNMNQVWSVMERCVLNQWNLSGKNNYFFIKFKSEIYILIKL